MPAPAARSLYAPASFRRLLACVPAAALLCAVALLTACSPAYDWREIRADEDHYRALMPARPDRLTRAIMLEDLPVQMTMQGAQIDGVAFTVAAAPLPDESVEVRERALAAMRTAMVRNVTGRELQAEAVPVPVLDAGGTVVGSAPGWRVSAEGTANGRPVMLHAIFSARPGRVWQAVVLGPDPDPDQTKIFLDGFRLVD